MGGKVGTWAGRHKISAGVIIVIIAIVGYYGIPKFFSSSSSAPTYTVAQVATSTIIGSVSGSGQVSASNEVSVSSQVSNVNVVYVGATEGQSVSKGTLLVELDPTNYNIAIQKDQQSLQSAQLALAKLQEAPTNLSETQAQASITSAEQNAVTASSTLAKDYQSAFTAITNTYLHLPSIMSGINSVLYKSTYTPSQQNISYYGSLVQNYISQSTVEIYQNAAQNDYQTALTDYNQSSLDYESINASAAPSVIDNLLQETYNTTQAVASATKSGNDFLGFVNNTLETYNATIPSQLATQQTTLASYLSEIESDSSTLLSSITSIQNDEQAVLNSATTLTEAQQSLAQLQAGADPLTIQSSQMSITQAQQTLADDEATLGNEYYIRAPFSGIVGTINATAGDPVPSGTIVTMISPNQLVNIPLNEVDATGVQVGDKATLTFDALPNLTIAGTVAEVDPIGTVVNGVVSYNEQITFDTENSAVKTGMSVNADIITKVAANALAVPAGAIKTSGTSSYVQVFQALPAGVTGTTFSSSVAPINVPVTIGITDDINTQILSGLSAGQYAVTATVSGSSSSGSTSSSAPSLFSAVGATRTGAAGGGGATFRAAGGL